jgi:hypothetical protein
MTFLECVSEIESPEYAARVNLASDYNTFVKGVRLERTTPELAAQIRDQGVGLKLVSRVTRMASQKVDHRYEHPCDAPMAAYIWLLAGTQPALAKIAANAAICVARSWWANRVAEVVLRDNYLAEDTETIEAVYPASLREDEASARALSSDALIFVTQSAQDLRWVQDTTPLFTIHANRTSGVGDQHVNPSVGLIAPTFTSHHTRFLRVGP